MNFTGKNLELVRMAITYALQEVHNQIATCPDVVVYEDDLDELEREGEHLRRLAARIDRKHPPA